MHGMELGGDCLHLTARIWFEFDQADYYIELTEIEFPYRTQESVDPDSFDTYTEWGEVEYNIKDFDKDGDTKDPGLFKEAIEYIIKECEEDFQKEFLSLKES